MKRKRGKLFEQQKGKHNFNLELKLMFILSPQKSSAL